MGVQLSRGGPSGSERVRWAGVVLLSLASVTFMMSGAFLPASGQLPGLGVRFVTLIGVGVVIGSLAVPGGGRLGLMLIWTAIGLSLALGTIGIFSVGMFYLAAFGLLVAALVLSPNRSGLESRGDWRFLIAFFAGYLGTFFLAFGLAQRM